MKLTKEDIKKMEKVGRSKKGDVFHILTHGGLNLIIEKTMGGELRVLGSGPHRAFSRHQAEKVDPSVQFDDSLWKSEKEEVATEIKTIAIENAEELNKNDVNDSSAQNHYNLAAHHSKVAGQHRERGEQMRASGAASLGDTHDAHMRDLVNSDIALKHYKMSGLDHKQAVEEHKKNGLLHSEVSEGSQAPHDDYQLSLSWNKKNPGKRPPKGLGWDFTA